MSFATKLMIAVIRNKSNPMAIKELNFNPSASPNWFAMILAIVLPVSASEVGRLFVLPMSMVTAMVSPRARPRQGYNWQILRNRRREK